MSKSGRNDPCPCGSGKKYKKCCLPRDEAARPRPVEQKQEEHFIAELRPDLDDEVDRLMEQLELGAGRAVESEIQALYNAHPRYHSTNFAMGVYRAMVMKDAVGAMAFFEKAVKIFPYFAQAHYNLGGAAQLALDLPKAVAAFRAAERYAQDGDGIAKLARDRLKALETIVLKGTTFPNIDAYLANAKLFDEAFQRLTERKFEKAAELFNLVLKDFPTHVQSYGNLALAYAGLGKRAAAMECFERALALDPKYGPAIVNRRVVEQMREGEPFIPGGIVETEYYPERVRRGD